MHQGKKLKSLDLDLLTRSDTYRNHFHFFIEYISFGQMNAETFRQMLRAGKTEVDEILKNLKVGK